MPQIISRMVRAARFEAALFDELRGDANATRQALLIVLLTSLLNQAVNYLKPETALFQGNEVIYCAGFVALAVITWYLVSLIGHHLATRSMGGEGSRADMMNCTGYAMSPLALTVLALIPTVGPFLTMPLSFWGFAIDIFAVSRTFKIGKMEATLTLLAAAVVVLPLSLGYIWMTGGLETMLSSLPTPAPR